jgi:DNA ligase D-like protein (predicted 3'-phosphoesterase)
LINFTYELINKGDPKDNWHKLAFFLRGFLKVPLDAEKVASLLDDMKVAQEVKKMADPHALAPASPTRSLTAVGVQKFDAELEEYKRKREFGETPEPEGTLGDQTPSTFVVQQHQAHKAGLHYDFRLASEGVLKSWAIPKLAALLSGQSQRVLAVEVEDHPLDYAAFEGTIPSGYGAGDVRIWDDGSYETVSQDENHWKFKLRGQHLRGTFTLFRIAGKNWNLRRAKENAT